MELKARRTAREMVAQSERHYDQAEMVRMLEEEMLQAANNLEFEKAAEIRDKIKELKDAPQIISHGAAEAAVADEASVALADAIHTGISNRLARDRERKDMTPQQKKVKRGPKKRG